MKRGARRYLLTPGRRGVKKVRVASDYELKLGEIEMDMDFMPPYSFEPEETRTMFIKLSNGNSWALFPADCDTRALARLLSVPRARRAELMERDPTQDGGRFLLESISSYQGEGVEEALKLGILVGTEARSPTG